MDPMEQLRTVGRSAMLFLKNICRRSDWVGDGWRASVAMCVGVWMPNRFTWPFEPRLVCNMSRIEVQPK